MPKFNFNKVALQICFAYLLHIFRAPFPKKASGGLLLVETNYSSSKSRQRDKKVIVCGKHLFFRRSDTGNHSKTKVSFMNIQPLIKE